MRQARKSVDSKLIKYSMVLFAGGAERRMAPVMAAMVVMRRSKGRNIGAFLSIME
jgi:hypothetical protein